ncbi:hypothetical protein [Arthrobacter woluwensis]|uniref:Uncharacterized protein n=1 Tax=Arthrobacter woluwensis TaxID=156980 RepID=A0A1H4W813_9MICC|nr:hypothetical protein [Arthrobacter woluwensis]SEC89345.1 hypothetical protein SAMN04489745_3443 [Arthrobacter woluwensis]SEC96206.1 hypothetical protein SAMN04489745_3561 [Arthrobacter woluwensis]
MPENSFLGTLQSLGFVAAKAQLLAWAREAGERLSVRDAKRIAGLALTATDPDDYRRLCYSDPVGEGIAARWFEFITT